MDWGPSHMPAARYREMVRMGVTEFTDDFDLVQFAHVAAVCRSSGSAAAAAKKLFAVSRRAKKSNNDSDRLAKYLARFGLKFKDIQSSRAT